MNTNNHPLSRANSKVFEHKHKQAHTHTHTHTQVPKQVLHAHTIPAYVVLQPTLHSTALHKQALIASYFSPFFPSLSSPKRAKSKESLPIRHNYSPRKHTVAVHSAACFESNLCTVGEFNCMCIICMSNPWTLLYSVCRAFSLYQGLHVLTPRTQLKFHHSSTFRDSVPVVVTPGPGEPRGVQVLVFTQHLIDPLKQLITQLTHLAWFIGSEMMADIKTKAKKNAHPVALQDQEWGPLIYPSWKPFSQRNGAMNMNPPERRQLTGLLSGPPRPQSVKLAFLFLSPGEPCLNRER